MRRWNADLVPIVRRARRFEAAASENGIRSRGRAAFAAVQRRLLRPLVAAATRVSLLNLVTELNASGYGTSVAMERARVRWLERYCSARGDTAEVRLQPTAPSDERFWSWVFHGGYTTGMIATVYVPPTILTPRLLSFTQDPHSAAYVGRAGAEARAFAAARRETAKSGVVALVFTRRQNVADFSVVGGSSNVERLFRRAVESAWLSPAYISARSG
jgi:hypothetical protein